MSLLKRRFTAIILIVAMLFIGSLGAVWASARFSPQPQTLEFGPQLFVILSNSDQLPAPLPATVVVHAQLNINLGSTMATHFIASGGGDDLAALDAANIPVRVIDADTSGKVYYFADASGENAQSLTESVGQLIYQDENVLLVAVTQATESLLLDTLIPNGIPISLLTSDPLTVQTADNLVVNQALAQPNDTPNAVIANLLPLLTEADLTRVIGELAGAQAATIDGNAVLIKTRYSLSPRIQDSERYLYQYYTKMGLPVSYANWTVGSYTGRNVVAEIRGRLHPERIWLLGGHFDAISQNSLNAAPGADDNATGTAATLLIANILRSYQFADTIRFVHFSGEEQGQWGSKVYARALSLQGAQIMGYINLDMIGWDGNGDRVVEVHTGMGAQSNALGTALIDNNVQYTQGLVFERKTVSASRFSDHSPFWDNGYPAVLGIENFFNDAITRDRNPWYHNTGDLLERVNVNYVARISRVALATLAELAALQTTDPNATPTPTLPPTATPTPLPTATPLPASCQNILLNGNFETTGNWQFGSTPYVARIVNSLAYEGARSLRLGVPPEAGNIYAHSSAFQKVTIPSNAAQVILRYQQRSAGPSDGVDYRETLLLRSNYSYWARVERNTGAGPDQWQERSFDLTAYRGNTLVLYLNVYNDGKSSQQWNYVDNIALLVCSATGTVGGEFVTPDASTATPAPDATPIPSLEWTSQVYLPWVTR